MNLRDLERESIRAFVQSAADDGYLSGRVLDYGCGKQPYRDIVEAAGGEYRGWDHPDYPANVGTPSHRELDPLQVGPIYDTVLCTQVVQYVPMYRYGSDPDEAWTLPTLFTDFRNDCEHLVLTYPTNWPEVEPEDLHRFTKAGMERLLTEAGFTIIRHERRASVGSEWSDLGETFALGYGVVARA